jgi:hypothetical protein
MADLVPTLRSIANSTRAPGSWLHQEMLAALKRETGPLRELLRQEMAAMGFPTDPVSVGVAEATIRAFVKC